MRRKYDIIKQLVSAISELPDDSQGRIFRASVEYLETGIAPQLDMVENTAFRCFKPLFDEVIEDERRLSEMRSNCGKKGGRPKKKITRKPTSKDIDSNVEKANESKKSNCFSEVENEKRKTERVEKEIFPPITPYKENPEREKEKETTLTGSKEKETDVLFPHTPSIPYQKIAVMWNEMTDKLPGVPKVAKMTDDRKRKIAQRLREMDEKDIGKAMKTYQDVLEKIPKSRFFIEKWKPSFDWLFANGSNWVRILEGNYGETDNYTRVDPPREPIKYTSVKDLL